MSLSIQQILENKGITPKSEHLEQLKIRWEGMQSLRGNLEGIAIDDADIAIRNLPGGDHIDNWFTFKIRWRASTFTGG